MSFSHVKNSASNALGRADELERFKTAINLTEYAAAQGYLVDRRASSRNPVVMRHPGGDKVVIARGEDQHWIYFSVRVDGDNGSIVDFVQRRRRCTLGDVRRELRPWIGSGIGGTLARPALKLYVPEVVLVSKDRAGVIRALAAMRPIESHRYLEEGRAIPRELLANPRFAGRILETPAPTRSSPTPIGTAPAATRSKTTASRALPRVGRRGSGCPGSAAPTLPW